MSKRKVTGRAAAKRTRFAEFKVQRGIDEREKAREHASKRNNAVVQVLTFVAGLRQQGRLPAVEAIKENAAHWQNAKGSKHSIADGNYELEWDLRRGYKLNEAAHWLPCSLNYEDKCISARASHIYAERLVREPFGQTSDLAAIYNDADQSAEDNGLRRALERSARRVAAMQPVGGDIAYAAIETVYHHEWVPRALLAYQVAIAANEPKWKMEKLRQKQVSDKLAQHIPLTAEDMEDDEDQSFYEMVCDILRLYEGITSRRTPLNLKRFELESLIRQLNQTKAEASAKKWPSKLELMPL